MVYDPVGLTPAQLEDGYWRAYRDFYTWRNIGRSAATHAHPRERLRHLAYAGGWKKFEPAWDALIRHGRVLDALPPPTQAGTRRRRSSTAPSLRSERVGRWRAGGRGCQA
ncbi:hypothetical protein OG216_04230 [Streptomycetaceae bacterium NBC_01309]